MKYPSTHDVSFQGWGLYAEYLGEEMGMYENDYEM